LKQKEINIMKKLLLAVTAMALVMTVTPASADAIDDIKAKGTLTVGVKSDFKPYGYRSANGNIIGIEIDLANKIANSLGVELKVIPVVASNRIQFLQNGKIDLIMATMADTKKRRKVIDIPKPNYYSSGPTVLTAKQAKIKSWDALQDRTVCGILGAWYNKSISTKFKFKMINFKTTGEAYKALQDSRCVGFLYEDITLLASTVGSEWDAFEMPISSLPSETYAWGIGVKKGETRLVELLSKMTSSWHKDGTIVGLEKQYNLPNSQFILDSHKSAK
jgi:polar amino acid transport system substrate-binding protein